MPTTEEYLQRLVQAKNDIATAITNKGGTVASGDGLEEFPADINTINTAVINPLTVTANGTYTAPLFVDGYNPVVVNVPSSQPILISKSITSNGTYTASSDNADGYSTVDVDVPNTYIASDEGKVVSNGSLVSQTATTKNTNGTYDTTLNNSVTVNVPTYSSADNGKVIQNGNLVSQTSASDSTINTNGTYDYDTTYNNSKKVIVSVPNTYTASDEGKVVDNGTLVSQTSTTFTDNGTYTTTTNDSVTVALPLTTKSISSNGTYNASSDSVKGYTSVSVNVPNTYTAVDEGKVVNNGALTSQTSTTKTSNGTYDTTLNNEVVIAVPNTYTASDEGKVVNNGALVSQTATSTNVNGTIDTTLNNSIVVNVPNTYTQSDEGKVVSNGALVSQTSDTYTTNGTYDTTLINSVTVNVAGSTPTSGAFYKELTSGNTTPKLCIAIIGTKGSSGYICGAYNGIVNTNPYDSFTLTDFTLSDYLSTSHTVEFTGRYSSSTTYYFKVTLNPTNNTVTFSNISGYSPPTNASTRSTAFSYFTTL